MEPDPSGSRNNLSVYGKGPPPAPYSLTEPRIRADSLAFPSGAACRHKVALRSPICRRDRVVRLSHAHDHRRQGHDSRRGRRWHGIHRRRFFRLAPSIPVGRRKSRRGDRDQLPEPGQLRQDAGPGRQDEVDVRLDVDPGAPLFLSPGIGADAAIDQVAGEAIRRWHTIQSDRATQQPGDMGGADITCP